MARIDEDARTRSPLWLVAIAAGAVVAVLLGIYSEAHDPTGRAPYTLGFSTLIAMKVWLAAAAGLLALVQLGSSLWLYGKVGRQPAPARLGTVHRLTGTAAFLLTLPVGYACLWALGFESYSTRVVIHGIAGCLFYGAFVTKIFVVRSHSSPGWLLPVVGGTVFTTLVLVVLTSSVYWFGTQGLPTNAPY